MPNTTCRFLLILIKCWNFFWIDYKVMIISHKFILFLRWWGRRTIWQYREFKITKRFQMWNDLCDCERIMRINLLQKLSNMIIFMATFWNHLKVDRAMSSFWASLLCACSRVCVCDAIRNGFLFAHHFFLALLFFFFVFVMVFVFGIW